MNIAAYCRVSTDKEDQLNSLDAQKHFFVEYAQKNRHTLVRLYADEGLSGTKIKRRKQFQQLLLDAEAGLFNMVVVKDISRLARNTVDLLQSVRHLKALGIETVFLTANMTSMGDSEFILTVFGALAQEESANTSKRVKFGKRINAEKGRVPNQVYGYTKIPGDFFHMSIHPEEAAIVRQIYAWYLHDGYGGGKIAALLNQRGVKTKRGCTWSQTAVCRILTNPLYTGKVINGKEEISDFLTSARAARDAEDWLIVDNPALRIIDEEQFQLSCALMRERQRQFYQERKRHSNKYLFSTLICCKECGWSFRRISRTYQRTYVRWVCSKRNGQGAQHCENSVSIAEEALIASLDEYFLSLLSNRCHVEQILRQELHRACRTQSDGDSRRKEVRAQLSKLQKQRQTYIELYAERLITKQELQQKLESGKEALACLEAERDQLEAIAPDYATVERIVRSIMENLPGFVSVKKLHNAQLKQLIEKIEVGKDGTVDVYLRFLLCRPRKQRFF